MPRLLIDTDVAIDYLRGQDYARRLLERLWNDLQPRATHPATAAFDLFFQASAVLKS